MFLSECDWSCNSCRGPLRSDCLQCMEGYVLQDGICVPGCSPGFYQDAERCLSQSSTKITTFIMSPTNQFSSSINFDISISQSVVTVGEGGRATNFSCIVPTSAAVLEPRFNGTLMDWFQIRLKDKSISDAVVMDQIEEAHDSHFKFKLSLVLDWYYPALSF